MTKIVINGAAGRMGRAVAEAVKKVPGAVVSGAIERAGHPEIGSEMEPGVVFSSFDEAVISSADALIDFSTPEALEECLDYCRRLRRPLVTGTTGLDAARKQTLEDAARDIPVFFSPNMSWGVNVLFRLTREASSLLREYQVEVVEVHHDQKLDAPSGTALRLAEIVSLSRGGTPEKDLVPGRRGRAETPRDPGEIGLHALRIGDVVGEHTVIFASGAERLEITHRAGSRLDFAAGAVRAALFLVGKKPGIYGMEDLFREFSRDS